MSRKHFQPRRILAALLTLLLIGGFLPLRPDLVSAADYTVKEIRVSKQYSRIEVPDKYLLTITGTNLGSISVSYLDNGGQLQTLANPSGGDGIKQYTIDPEKIGSTLFIEGPGGTKEYNISETKMSKITELNPKSVKTGENLTLKVANGKYLDGLEYKAYYSNQITEEDISSRFAGGDQATITLNTTGFYSVRFERNFKALDGTPINISYRYLDIFRVFAELDGVSAADDINMFPNRGEKGSTVYFRAPELKQDMSIFFLKKDDGTDNFTQANKGSAFSYQKDAEGTIDVVTVKVPAGLTAGEEYFVYFTNQIPDQVDPMDYVFKQQRLKQKFMVINVGDKVQVFNVTPNSGPDTGQSIEITGRYLGTLNITGLTAGAVTDNAISFSPDQLQMTIDYGNGTYSGEAVTGVKKTVRVNVANSASFEADKTKKAANFTAAADRIYVKTPTFPIVDKQNTAYPVEVRTTTSFTRGGVNYIFEEFTSYTGFTFIPSMIAPVVGRATPDKIQIEERPGSVYAVKTETLLAIYGKDFKIYRETLADGLAVVRYPIVRILNGESVEIEINPNTGQVLGKDGQAASPSPEMYLFDAAGNLLDGSVGKQTGTRMLVKIPQGTRVAKPVPDSSPRSIRVVNPIKNSPNPGIHHTAEDILQFVLTGQTPVISSVAPDVVTVQGGENITIKGGNFRVGVKVIIDGQEVSAVTRDGIGENITFKAPPGRAGETQLQVLNPEGGIAVWPFTYVTTYTDPKISSFAPAAGNTGTLVVVKGENFMAPDPTAGAGEIHKLIGARIWLGSQEINHYNRDAFNRIQLINYTNAAEPVLSASGQLAGYYHSVVFEDEAVQKYYILQQQPDGTVKLNGGTDDNSYVISVDSSGLKATKINGGSFDLVVSAGALNLGGVVLTMKTPYTVQKGVITGNYGKVINSGEVRFTVPILSADGYYDLTIVNPDTKKAAKTGNQGFYYYIQPQSRPTITAIDPNEGSISGGYTIDINGSDFQDNGLEKSRVSINGVEIKPADTTVSVDGKKITVIVPAYPGDLWKDLGTGRLTVPIVVLNPDGASVSREMGFTYIVPGSYPLITKIVPERGTAAGGSVVEITGRDFRYFEPFEDRNRNQVWDPGEPYHDLNHNGSWDDYTGQTAQELKNLYGVQYQDLVTPVLPVVFFGRSRARVEEFSSGYLKVITPAAGAGKTEVYVVNNDSGISNRANYTYESSSPKIDKIIPDQGAKKGRDKAEIYGSGFYESQLSIYQGPALINSATMPLIRFGDITNRTIAREQPYSGRIDNGRTTVNLEGGLKVEYDAAENGQVTVEINEDKQTYRKTFLNYDGSIKFIDLSQLVNITQSSQTYPGFELLRLEIKDRRLLVERGYTPEASLVRTTQIMLKTPSYFGVGKVPVTIFNPDGGIAAGQYEYKNPDSRPAIINITKDGNPPVEETYQGQTIKIIRLTYKGGNIITLIGQDFREDAIIQISNLIKIEPGAITYNLPGRMTFTMPAVDKSALGQLHRVMVINTDGASGASDQAIPPVYLQFIEGTTGPQIDKITPDKGPATGGTQVKIEGSDFRAGLKVYFGESPVAAGNIKVVDYKTVLVVSPPSPAGKKGIKVENPDGELSASVDFTYISCPRVAAVVDPADPAENSVITSISVEGSQEIKIKGSGFMAGGRVIFSPLIKKAEKQDLTGSDIIYIAGVPYQIESGSPGSDFKFIDAETITVNTPPGKVDTRGLIVINPDNGASEPYENIIYGLPGLKPPTGVAAELVYDRYIKVHWAPVEGARYYEIYALVKNKQPEFIDTTTLTSLVYTDLKPRTSYKFMVKAGGDFGPSQPSVVSNTVTTGRVAGPPDDDGSLGENTTMFKTGTTALVTIGTRDNKSEVLIDLTRGTLAGCKELVLSLPAEVITGSGPDIKVYGPDYLLRFNPRVFKINLMRDNAYRADAGVRFQMSPYRGSLNIVGGNNLSTPYQLTAEAFNGKNSSPLPVLAGNMSLSLDFDPGKSSLRRLARVSLCRFNEYNQTWEQLGQSDSTQTTAVTGLINRLGRYTVMGSRR